MLMEEYQSKTPKSNKIQSIEDMQRRAPLRPQSCLCVRLCVRMCVHMRAYACARRCASGSVRCVRRFMDAYPEFKQLGGSECPVSTP